MKRPHRAILWTSRGEAVQRNIHHYLPGGAIAAVIVGAGYLEWWMRRVTARILAAVRRLTLCFQRKAENSTRILAAA